MAKPIRLLVIEDSSYMLMAIRAMVKLSPEIEIVGEARDGQRGVELAIELRPDVVTMDVNMPGLNGIDATRRIMREAPTAIIMLSSMTERGLLATGEALGAGAIDYIPKTMSAVDIDLATIATTVAGKIKFWGECGGHLPGGGLALPPLTRDTDLVLVAGGRGSPLLIGDLLAGMQAPACPVLVSLDMLTPQITANFVEHLARVSAMPVREAVHGRPLEPGVALVVPGGRRAMLVGGASRPSVDLRASSDRLLTSALAACDCPQLILLSGAAREADGLQAALQGSGASLWLQQAETCVEAGLVQAAAGHSHLVLAPRQGERDQARHAA